MRRVVPTPAPDSPVIATALDLGAHIRAARTQSGLTLEEAALSVGVSKQTMQNIETNPAKVGLGTVLEVSRALGVSVFAFPAEHQSAIVRALDGQVWLSLAKKAKKHALNLARVLDNQK